MAVRSTSFGLVAVATLLIGLQWSPAAALETDARACLSIADIADHGDQHLRTVNLVGRDLSAPIDLRNDGHPDRLRVIYQGTAGMPALANEAGEPIGPGTTDYYFNLARWATEIGVLRVEGRVWEVEWDAGSLDDSAALIAATDGSAVCEFHTTWLQPTFQMLPGGKPDDAETYRDILTGGGEAPPSAALDKTAVAASLTQYGPGLMQLRALSWRVDLMGTGKPVTLARIDMASGRGRGCDHTFLGLVEDNKITALGIVMTWPQTNLIAPMSPVLDRLASPLFCMRPVETPVLGRDMRAYVLIDNTVIAPEIVDRIRLLAGARDGFMQALARLSWRVQNEVVLP
jgi:hypothetical protein